MDNWDWTVELKYAAIVALSAGALYLCFAYWAARNAGPIEHEHEELVEPEKTNHFKAVETE